VAATSFSVASSTKITAVSPAEVAGANIYVTTSAGMSAAVAGDVFTYTYMLAGQRGSTLASMTAMSVQLSKPIRPRELIGPNLGHAPSHVTSHPRLWSTFRPGHEAVCPTAGAAGGDCRDHLPQWGARTSAFKDCRAEMREAGPRSRRQWPDHRMVGKPRLDAVVPICGQVIPHPSWIPWGHAPSA
jgi:hypothetical protein